ncbi:MAG: AEC family transporter [Clostridia bacterium]|nr:AEC family transporter [Clostridia bacterium]
MIDITNLFNSVLLLLLMIVPGVLMAKFGLSNPLFGKGIANLILYVTQPALIIFAYIRDFDREILIRALIVFLFAVAAHLIFTLIAFLLYKKHPSDIQAVLRFATIFTNAGYMGIPLIKSILNDEATIYASIYVIVFNIFVWTVGCYIFTGDKKYISLKKALLNPATISTAIGFIIFILPINQHLPSVAINLLIGLKDMVAPLSMLLIGLQLAKIELKGIFKDLLMYKFLVLRMLLIPTIVWALLKAVSLLGYSDPTVMTVTLLCSATPVATATSMFAEIFDGNTVYSSKIVSISTVLSLLTMPIIAFT